MNETGVICFRSGTDFLLDCVSKMLITQIIRDNINAVIDEN